MQWRLSLQISAVSKCEKARGSPTQGLPSPKRSDTEQKGEKAKEEHDKIDANVQIMWVGLSWMVFEVSYKNNNNLYMQ